MKNQLECLLVGQLLSGLDNTVIDRFFQDTSFVKPLAVIFNLDNDVSGLMKSPQFDSSRLVLSCFCTVRWRFNTVIDGVSHHMNKWVGDFIDYAPVEFGFLSVGDEVYFFAGLVREVSNQSGHFLEYSCDRNHAHRH